MSDVKNIAMIGAGTMGSGIAQVAATAGCGVDLVDVNGEVLSRAQETIGKFLDRAVEKGRLDGAERDAIAGRIRAHDSIESAARASREAGKGIDLAIEAVVEKLEVKHAVFRALESAFGAGAVLATNTSSLPVTKIAEALEHRGRVVGMHFFNPAPLMPLVEIVAGAASEGWAVDAAYDAAKAWGKTPVRVKDVPGFIVNRVARGFYLEALRLLGEGVAGVDEIDLVMRKHGGFKMGPFELVDLVGLDVNYSVSRSVWEQFDRAARFAPHEIQGRLVERGHLGRKTGRGFYAYEEGRAVPAYAVDRRSYTLTPLLSDAMLSFARRAGADSATSTEQLILARILGAVMNEGAHALSDGIATGADIDTAMIKGTNYPKGPLAWIDKIGPHTVRGVLRALNQSVTDDRYAPARMLVDAD